MLKQNKIVKSLSLAALALIATACGSKVQGTYTLGSITGSGGMSAYYQQYCTGVILNVQSGSNNLVTAYGTSGSCSVSLTGTDNSGTINVTSFSINITGMQTSQQCSFTGMLTLNNNILTGSLNGTSTSSQYGSQNGSQYGYGGYNNGSQNGYNTCGTVNLTGTKTN